MKILEKKNKPKKTKNIDKKVIKINTEFKSQNFIYTKKIKTITCNPFIFTRGNKINNTAISLFMDSRWNTSKEESRDDKSEKVEK